MNGIAHSANLVLRWAVVGISFAALSETNAAPPAGRTARPKSKGPVLVASRLTQPGAGASRVSTANPLAAQPPVPESTSSPLPSENLPAGSEVPPAAGESAVSEPPSAPNEANPNAGGQTRAQVEALPQLRPTNNPELQLAEVLSSVYAFYPELAVLRGELQSASGRQLAAWGAYDFKIVAESLDAPMGFYQNYRQLAKVEQPLWRGGAVSGQYRLGRGFYPDWYGERETDDGGEFKIRFSTPLLRDRRIDAQRADLFQATLRRQQFDPVIQGQLLEFSFAAADVYWSWVLAGLSLEVQQDLLQLTAQRNVIYEQRVKAKDLPAIELLQNQRLVASRQAKVLEGIRKFQQSAIKLSLFYRDRTGTPLLADPGRLPDRFPAGSLDGINEANSVSQGLTLRPEFRDLDYQRRVASVDLAYGRNQRLPNLGVLVDASKDVGPSASSKRDKTPFELEAGLLFDMPLQRRKAAGKIVESQGKLASISAKRVFVENKVVTQIQDSISALTIAWQRIEQTALSARLAKELAEIERKRFELGDSDLLRVTLQETAAVETQIAELEARADFFRARAAWLASMGISPLEW